MPVAFMADLAEKWANRPQFVHESPPHYKQTSLNTYVKTKGKTNSPPLLGKFFQSARKKTKSPPHYKQTSLNTYVKTKGKTNNPPLLGKFLQSARKKTKSTPSPTTRALRNSTAAQFSGSINIRSEPAPIPILTTTSTFTAPVLCIAYPWSRLLVMGLKTGEIRSYLFSAPWNSVVPGRLCWIMETKGVVQEKQVESHIAKNAIENGDRVGSPPTSQQVIGAVVFDNDENAVLIKSKEHMMTLANHHLINESSTSFPTTYPTYMWRVTRSYVMLNAWKFKPNNAQGSRKAMAVTGLLEDTTIVPKEAQ
jgi:hypothetical protein